jgi:translation initiation factor IF-2
VEYEIGSLLFPLLLVNDKPLKQGLPSQPVRIIGFKSLPKAGDPIMCVESEEVAEELVATRAALLKAESGDRPDASRADIEVHIYGMKSRDTARSKRVHDRADITASDGTIRIPIVVKADADGSLSAVRDSLVSLGKNSSYKVLIDPVLEGIGEITASDIQMAKESNAAIFVFGGKGVNQSMLNLAESEGVTIRSNGIIYSLLDDARDILGKYLPQKPVEHVHGRAMVQAIFNIGTDSGEEKVAGLKITDGHIYQAKTIVDSKEIRCHFRVLRDGKRISPDGETVTASSLRRFKELVDSVRLGDECGLALSGFTDFQEGDEIQCYSIEMKTGLL